MTTVDVVFRYERNPSEAVALGIARLREVYGIRRVEFSETKKTVLVEYDSTRLTEQIVQQLLRRGGLSVGEKVVMFTPAVAVETAPAAS